ncbi:MAG: GNAT family N-acetyltransferase [Pseudomonadota bacterium]|nr:GNAT family N-acetyltransferase [Pseudomonadota bacterium]
MIEIEAAELPEHLAHVRRLFREYADALGIDLCFQNFEAELAELPGRYAPPDGRLLLAWHGTRAIGCVALRPVDGPVCEMKRLYVDPSMRGRGLGRALAERICNEAREAGYRRICLDTLPSMSSAIELYSAMNFQPVTPYVFNPVRGVVFLGLEL